MIRAVCRAPGPGLNSSRLGVKSSEQWEKSHPAALSIPSELCLLTSLIPVTQAAGGTALQQVLKVRCLALQRAQ